MIIPFEKLSSQAFKGIVEEYISRDGTDSGHIDVSFQKKFDSIKSQLASGKIFIVFDAKSESCNIISKEELEKSEFEA